MTGISGHSYIVNKFLETYMRILGPNQGCCRASKCAQPRDILYHFVNYVYNFLKRNNQE